MQQFPHRAVGFALDLIGPRRTVLGTMLFAVIGAVLFAYATSATMLIIAMGLIGIGCSAVPGWRSLGVSLVYCRAKCGRASTRRADARRTGAYRTAACRTDWRASARSTSLLIRELEPFDRRFYAGNLMSNTGTWIQRISS